MWRGESQPERRYWPEISSPLARRLVRVAWDMSGHRTYRGNVEYLAADLPAELVTYRDELRRRLAHSGIVERLADGPGAFPDIHERLTGRTRLLARLSQPRSYSALTRKIIRDLDWYLDPRLVPESQRTLFVNATITLMIIGTLFFYAGLFSMLDPNWTCIVGLVIFFGAFLANNPASKTYNINVNYRQHAEKIRATEFYLYLCRSLADNDAELEPDRALPAAQQRKEHKPESKRKAAYEREGPIEAGLTVATPFQQSRGKEK